MVTSGYVRTSKPRGYVERVAFEVCMGFTAVNVMECYEYMRSYLRH